jgi:hypothetical protein
VDKIEKKMGISVIIRNGNGQVLATLVEPKNHIIVLNVAEAMAVLEGEVLQIVQVLEKGESN